MKQWNFYKFNFIIISLIRCVCYSSHNNWWSLNSLLFVYLIGIWQYFIPSCTDTFIWTVLSWRLLNNLLVFICLRWLEIQHPISIFWFVWRFKSIRRSNLGFNLCFILFIFVRWKTQVITYFFFCLCDLIVAYILWYYGVDKAYCERKLAAIITFIESSSLMVRVNRIQSVNTSHLIVLLRYFLLYRTLLFLHHN